MTKTGEEVKAMRSMYCEHPDGDVEVRPTNSMWGGANCYCSACGHQWYATQKELDAVDQRRLNPPLRTLEDIEIENLEGCNG